MLFRQHRGSRFFKPASAPCFFSRTVVVFPVLWQRLFRQSSRYLLPLLFHSFFLATSAPPSSAFFFLLFLLSKSSSQKKSQKGERRRRRWEGPIREIDGSLTGRCIPIPEFLFSIFFSMSIEIGSMKRVQNE